ncbi:hypothetical protein [Nostoc sp. WHI]|nr:hypothetical protein [Nostoc sp. WHI]
MAIRLAGVIMKFRKYPAFHKAQDNRTPSTISSYTLTHNLLN